jgi:hypothetical protein
VALRDLRTVIGGLGSRQAVLASNPVNLVPAPASAFGLPHPPASRPSSHLSGDRCAADSWPVPSLCCAAPGLCRIRPRRSLAARRRLLSLKNTIRLFREPFKEDFSLFLMGTLGGFPCPPAMGSGRLNRPSPDAILRRRVEDRSSGFRKRQPARGQRYSRR